MCNQEQKEKLEEKIIDLSNYINFVFKESKEKKLLNISNNLDNLLQEVHKL